MATHTTYYNLTKPSSNDKVNIGVLNDNADIIDTALHDIDNTIDNLDADDISYGSGSVEDALDELTANTFGTQVALTSYTSANRFTCPYDGYIKGNIRNGGTIYAYVNGVLMIGVTSATQQTIVSQFVKKGHQIYCSDVSGNVDMTYFPMSS